MESFSIWHWLIVIIVFLAAIASPILGVVRGVMNRAVVPAVLSILVPVYGLVYFFSARRKP